MVPGGAWVLHNLSPIVLLTESTPGTGHKYVVTQSCLVNHPPCLSYVSPSCSTSWEVDLEESSTESGADMSEGSSWTCVPTGLCWPGLACMVCILRWREQDHHGPWSPPRLHSPPPHKLQPHHFIRSNILNSLSQSEHFISCNETFWQLPPWPHASRPQGEMAWVSVKVSMERLTQT